MLTNGHFLCPYKEVLYPTGQQNHYISQCRDIHFVTSVTLAMPVFPKLSAPNLGLPRTADTTHASLWQRIRQRRPSLSTEALLLCTCVYFTLFCNVPFWESLLTDWRWGLAAAGYALAIACALTALHFVLLAPWLTHWNSKLLLSLLILVATGANFYSSKFHVYYDVSMLRNMLQTDAKEATELLSVGMMLKIVLLAAPGILLVNYVQIKRAPLLRSLGRRVLYWLLALVVVILAIASVLKDFSSFMRNHKEVRYLITPSAMMWSLAKAGVEDAEASGPRTPVAEDAHLGPSWAQVQKPTLLVFVVGETARAANWGLNQAVVPSARDTTPLLAQRDVINFPDMHSCGTNTAVSLPCMFSLQGRRNYDEQAITRSESVLHVLHRAGLRVVWNENQSGCKGVCDGLETIRPQAAQWPDLCAGKHCMDMALLKSSQPVMEQANDNLVLFMHQMGNHGPAYFLRHPQEFKYFTPTCDTEDLSQCNKEQVQNSYDNALRYTDYLLASTIDVLKDLEDKYDTALIYVSDHGESLGEKGVYLHGMPYAIAPKEQTHIPMVMWFSSGFAQRHQLDADCLQRRAAQRADHDHLFHTLLGLLDVRTQVWNPELDLSATCRPAVAAP